MENLLPIGSVVVLKDDNQKLMIIGVLQVQKKDESMILWDYAACAYPLGIVSKNSFAFFNAEHIDRVLALGYQDEDQLHFQKVVSQKRDEARKNAKIHDGSSEE